MVVKIFSRLILLVFILECLVSCKENQQHTLSPKEKLGKLLFFDTGLSEPVGQSCATCHAPEKGFTDIHSRPSSEGAVKGLFSNRNSMTVAYSAFVPALAYDEKEGTYIGGLFWDGRANTLVEQVDGPLLNPLEMANTDKKMVVEKVKKANYYPEIVRLYGNSVNVDSIYNYVKDALSAYQQSTELNPFSSKYDDWIAGKYILTDEEQRGMELFKDKGMCAECHILDDDPLAGKSLFTDHTYDNLGIPKNPVNPFYSLPAGYNPHGADAIDPGLGKVVGDSAEYGKFRVPTLRNIALTAPYGHNGYFQTLEEIVHFYNVRDVSNEFPAAEYPATINKDELGDLKLTPQEEAELVAFLKTFTDGYRME